MSPLQIRSIRAALSSKPECSGRFLWGGTASACIGDLATSTNLSCRVTELQGRSVLLATRDQLAAALALVGLDGIARRLIICPPDLRPEQFYPVVDRGEVDVIVSDHELSGREIAGNPVRVRCGTKLVHAPERDCENCCTEWVLLTSGTSTGVPKMTVHTMASLAAPIGMSQDREPGVVWGTFYDIRRYGGLQVFLRAVLGSGSFVLGSAGEPVSDYLERLGAHGVTHLSGTPTHWRRALMSPQSGVIAPRYIRLSGEIADQTILNMLHARFPDSAIGHAFASTEAGVAFEVNDGLAGFPANMLGKYGETEMKIANDSLQIRSDRVALRYLDGESGVLANEDGFVDTGDVVELRGDRYHFLGRRNGVINVGGLKVYPEEVEAVINRHPSVRMSMVRSRRNPITGSLVSAEVVRKEIVPGDASEEGDFESEILELCRQNLAPHKIPATIRCVPALEIAAAGKLLRRHA